MYIPLLCICIYGSVVFSLLVFLLLLCSVGLFACFVCVFQADLLDCPVLEGGDLITRIRKRTSFEVVPFFVVVSLFTIIVSLLFNYRFCIFVVGCWCLLVCCFVWLYLCLHPYVLCHCVVFVQQVIVDL